VTEALTTLLDESRSWNVLLLIVVGSMATLKVAVTDVEAAIPVAPLAGVYAVTFGTLIVLNTISTQ
jgi:hypothetical protein